MSVPVARTIILIDAGSVDFRSDLAAFDGAISSQPPTPEISLNALALSTTALTSGAAVTIAITGATDGSTIAGTPPNGMTLDSAGREISGTPTTAGDYDLVLTQTLAGAVNSPRQTTIGVTVAAAPVVTPTPTPSSPPSLSFLGGALSFGGQPLTLGA